jgi:Leucine-rich repeat (LRR) protein
VAIPWGTVRGHSALVTVTSLDALRSLTPDDPVVVDLVLPEIGGGRAVAADFAAIAAKPDASALRVSGLDQGTFELLVEQHGRQFTAIHFWKCPRVEDLSPLEDLSALTFVAYFWNQRASSLWDLTRTPNLRGLQVEDFTKLKKLDDLVAGTTLEELEFGDGIWVKNSVESLDPLSSLVGLRRLSFALRKILDGRIQPIGELRNLEYLQCPTNLFTTEQLAWLRAHLPATESRVLNPVVRFDHPIAGDDSADVLVIGKRKPFLNSKKDRDRIDRYISKFEEMVQQFREDPAAEPKAAG